MTPVEAELAEELYIVTGGARLDDLIGQDFVIGSALLHGVRSCDPCGYLESVTRPGLFDDLGGRRGLRARIVPSGTIAVGDHVDVPRVE